MKRALVLSAFVAAQALADAGSVRGSKHDLSVTGPGPIKATRERQPCAFCHALHGGVKKGLLSRPDPVATHRPYESGTLRGRPNAPSGSSRVCLSCHDGTIAVGQTRRGRIEVTGATADGRIPDGRRSNLGTDLRHSHPISIGVGGSGNVRKPGADEHVKLDAQDQVQCTSCHDPHSEFGGSPEGMFLLAPTRGSELCASCHVTPMGSSHATSSRPFEPLKGEEPGYGTVAAAGCMACHRNHGASPKGELLRISAADADEALCLRCHAGGGAEVDVGRQLAKASSHGEPRGGRHDASEGPSSSAHRLPEAATGAARHVTCVDCHDPHAATRRAGMAQRVAGALDGVWGIDQHGARVDPVQFEYQICFKCHGDSANQPRASGAATPRRAAEDANLRRVFSSSAPSAHPVLEPGRNPDVPSLRSPLGVASLIQCSDCHASDDGPGAATDGPAVAKMAAPRGGSGGARGPHGSVYRPLLERNYSTTDPTVESPAAYALCYKCHDREKLLSDASAFRLHRRHVVDASAPCSACHSAHGVSPLTGTAENNAHLVDFDLSVVRPLGGGRPYASAGPRRGSCNLTCHGRPAMPPHAPAAY